MHSNFLDMICVCIEDHWRAACHDSLVKAWKVLLCQIHEGLKCSGSDRLLDAHVLVVTICNRWSEASWHDFCHVVWTDRSYECWLLPDVQQATIG
jgi:hypothetical protein